MMTALSQTYQEISDLSTVKEDLVRRTHSHADLFGYIVVSVSGWYPFCQL
jgi:hypothetical protein